MNTLKANWPPVASDSVGFKTIQGQLQSQQYILPLSDLVVHSHAWWYGCRFVCEKTCQLRVRLCSGETILSEWTQTTGEWRPLPWLLPGSLAEYEKMCLHIDRTDDDSVLSPPPFFSVTAAYIELPTIPPMDRFLFVSADGDLVAHWNRFRKEFGTPDVGPVPMWQTLHTVIPPTQLLLDDEWRGTTVFCIHDWTETVAMDVHAQVYGQVHA
jgi:hypothetical protein